jgi:hypothetical protein
VEQKPAIASVRRSRRTLADIGGRLAPPAPPCFTSGSPGLLSEQLEIQLCNVGTKERLTFADGEHEQKLSEWMGAHALVCWVEHPRPWEIEHRLIEELQPPLNLQE